MAVRLVSKASNTAADQAEPEATRERAGQAYMGRCAAARRARHVNALPACARILALGGGGDLRAALADERFALQILTPEDSLDKLEWAAPDVIILDRGRFSLDAARAVRLMKLGRAPLLVIDPAPGDGAALDAEDALLRPFEQAELHRRLSILIDLGRSRRALGLAERALERARAALDERQQFTSAVLEGIHTAVLTTDPRGRITFANRVAVSTLRLPVEQIVGYSVAEVLSLPPEARACFFDSPREEPPVGERRFAYTLRRPDGTELEIGLSMSRAEGAAHHGLGYYLVFRDLAETQKLDRDVRRVERLAAMGTMVAGFAHEVRNPVASLRLLGEALDAEIEPGDPRREFLSRMQHQLERIERLVKTSLQFGRPEPPRRGVHRPAVLAALSIEAIIPRIRKSERTIRLDVDPGLPTVYVDDAQLVQVLVILLNNALDAAGTPDKVRMRVRANLAPGKDAAAPCEEVRFEVIDEGPGIPAYMLGHVFDPFFTTKPNGTGLGLSIAQQLVHENHGRIELSSAVGRGTTFAVLLPQGAP